MRSDFVKDAFQPRYSGPYVVVQRNDKTFTSNTKDSLKNVSIDRLKVAYLLNETHRISTFPANSVFPSDSQATTEAPYSNSLSTNTCSGKAEKDPPVFEIL